jgi:very-short-patch-repair endonuclease
MIQAEIAQAWVTKMRAGRRRDTDVTGVFTALSRCESPIELGFCLSLFQVQGITAVEGDFTPTLLPRLVSGGRVIAVFAQQPILHYRADFLLVGLSPTLAEPQFIVIECDGAAFHSTREQVRRDVGRQAALVNTGFRVIRFTGSQIYSTPEVTIHTTIAAFGWKTQSVGDLTHLRGALAELFAMEATP